MPKRSAEEKIERYERKIKKLRKRDIGRHRRIRTISDSSNNEGAEDVDQPGPNLIANANDGGNASGQSPAPSITGPEPMPEPDPTPEPEPALEPVEPPVLEAVLTEQNPNGETAEPELDPELLDALGESTSDTPEFGEKIHESLAKLWLPLLVKGLPKDKKETMLKEYLIPDNCRLLQAPKLNAEISAAVIDSVRNRDKILVAHQQQLGSGITAINRALNILLNGEDKKSAIQHLSNACRILSDLHTINTNSRIKLITPNLDKNFLHVVQDSLSVHQQPLFEFGKLVRPTPVPFKPRQPWREENDTTEPPSISELDAPAASAEAGSSKQASCPGAVGTQRTPSSSCEPYPGCREALRQAFSQRCPPEALDLMLASLSDGTAVSNLYS
ncbi:hypothetical protein MSG28_011204 [Choristoneura fumiferana]|uniref:Uncharacterized protein n=1 Tax=Choristoneura fumiferana TaxID=7141 RepID=A0ACC0KQS2_CHOFU|nr:hypothetical protein MSG28_011204 [Choristoneura fumiferana]